ncbi:MULTISPECIES: restriction endonuclease subunit S [Providencia]|uniref:Restriction endonuclease subunit S n=1 Tax=Providencia stuartii TaxID=588 RepID=A0AAJ1JN81_PROST|nr:MULTISPECIES: restriction endonuclease subunit S [Providencia]MDE8751560.1 restriction endonuclease subunit S [Providencia thailandensis]MDE8770405.1 restriction endonuclease subunit S [Providencia thailandensis]MDE8774711.1 restriction endonuclease subunit S [Providencia thailandensis]MDE8791074.1 restriction endonuclease subunit S [Providencia thailandensis]QIB29563.1 restriction endonuclease subunit S [Providencia stuartii]
MSQLSYLEKLLDGVDVEWTTLGNEHAVEIANSGRKPVKAALRVAGETPYYGANNIQDYVDGYTHAGEFVLIAEDGSASLENYSIQYATGRFWANNHVHVVRGKEGLNTRYLYHYLCIVNFVPFLSGGGRAKLTKGKLVDIPLPIPCPDNPEKSLAIQSEIVRILDKFTALTAELTAELNMRKKQYNYYRDQLLSFEEGDFEWMTLGDVTKKWYSGGTPTAGKPEFYEGGNIPWLRTQEVKFSDVSETEVFITPAALKNSSAKWIPENCVIIAISGATAGRTAINKIPLTTNQHCGCLEIDDKKALYRYVFHWVSFNYENIKALGQGARGDLNSTIIKNFRLPVPYANDPEKSLAEQARIVAILDKFDTLTTSLQEGLPREIELRQKQYEYYRDLLLSFPKSDEAA